MELPIHLPEAKPAVRRAVIQSALKKAGLETRHEKEQWIDWLTIPGMRTVISLSTEHGCTRSGTIEFDSDELDDVRPKIIAAFRTLGWYGSDDEGEYLL